MLPSFSYVRPETLRQAVSEADTKGSRIHAGGTDLLGCLHDGVFGAEKVVSLRDLEELRGVSRSAGGGLRIGALTTITEVAENPTVGERYAALARGASEVASPQLRHQGTIGGNLCQKPRCWYYRGEFDCLRKGGKKCFAVRGENQFHCLLGGSGCFIVHPSDTAPALVALDAEVEVRGRKGERRLSVADLHVPPKEDPRRETRLETGEIITAVLLPKSPPGLRSSYRKVRARQSWDFAVAGVALALEMDGSVVKRGRVVLSGAAPVPWRVEGAEKLLAGKRLDRQLAGQVAEAALEGAKPLEHNGYKIPLFRGLIEDELVKLVAG